MDFLDDFDDEGGLRSPIPLDVLTDEERGGRPRLPAPTPVTDQDYASRLHARARLHARLAARLGSASAQEHVRELEAAVAAGVVTAADLLRLAHVVARLRGVALLLLPPDVRAVLRAARRHRAAR